MPATFEPIATTTLGSAASTITFSSIPGTYTDLRLVIVGSGDTTALLYFYYNSDTGTNYSNTRLTGDGSTAASARQTGIAYNRARQSTNSSNPSLNEIDIFSYAGSTNKTCLITSSNDQNGSGDVYKVVSLWRSTAAITSITLLPSSGNFNSGTTATLYGIKAA